MALSRSDPVPTRPPAPGPGAADRRPATSVPGMRMARSTREDRQSITGVIIAAAATGTARSARFCTQTDQKRSSRRAGPGTKSRTSGGHQKGGHQAGSSGWPRTNNQAPQQPHASSSKCGWPGIIVRAPTPRRPNLLDSVPTCATSRSYWPTNLKIPSYESDSWRWCGASTKRGFKELTGTCLRPARRRIPPRDAWLERHRPVRT